MQKKESVQKKIDYLKRDIQYLIDRKKNNYPVSNIGDIDTEKQKKINELSSLTKVLSQIENEETQKDIQLKAVVNAIDSLESKISRGAAKDDYSLFLESCKYEPQDMPGYLFLHNKVLEKYGVCEHIKMIMGNDTFQNLCNKTTNVKALREEWLSKTIDKGQTFYDLRDKIIYSSEIVSYQKEREVIIAKIDNSIKNCFTNEQYILWEKCLALISEYQAANVKTKKMKDKFNHVINDLSVLFSQTNLPVHDYLSIIYKNLMFVVNSIDVGDKTKIDDDVIQQFVECIGELQKISEKIDTQQKHKATVIQNLNNEYYLFCTNKKSFSEYNKHIFIHTGKYFKKWSALTNEERLERLQSYAEYFVESHMISSNIIHAGQKSTIVEQLVDVLLEGYRNKTLTFRYLKWDIKYGIITSVDILKYNKEEGRFYLLNTKPATAAATAAGAAAATAATAAAAGTVTGAVTAAASMPKRKSSTKNYITSTNEAKLNEIILTFVIKNMKDIASKKLSKEDCLEEIKQKLYLKKLSPEDKSQIFLRYDLIAKTVS